VHATSGVSQLLATPAGLAGATGKAPAQKIKRGSYYKVEKVCWGLTMIRTGISAWALNLRSRSPELSSVKRSGKRSLAWFPREEAGDWGYHGDSFPTSTGGMIMENSS